jgi:hypothetical protein
MSFFCYGRERAGRGYFDVVQFSTTVCNVRENEVNAPSTLKGQGGRMFCIKSLLMDPSSS